MVRIFFCAACAAFILSGIIVAGPAVATAGAPASEPAAVREQDPLILSAPPREPAEESERLYQPLADFLGRALGRRVVYRHPGTWGAYGALMRNNAYDLVFDDPHLNSYRVEHLDHQVLARLPGSFQYAAIARTDFLFKSVQRMHGRTICTYAPPHLGTLFVLSIFDNPARQPSLVSVHSWEETYRGVIAGRCAAGILPLAVLQRLDPERLQTKVLFNSTEFPNQALSAGPRLSAAERERLVAALVSPAAARPTAALRAAWGDAPGFLPARREEFEGLAAYLKDEWGFF